MNNKFESNISNKNNLTLNILSELENVTNEDIEFLKKRTLPEKIDSLDKIPEENKKILALLIKLNDNELAELIAFQNKAKSIVGIHNVKSKLLNLGYLTGDNKYYKLTKSDDQ